MPEERKGELYIFLQVFLWGLFPVVTVATYAGLSPLSSLGWSLVCTAVFFLGLVAYRNLWSELKNPALWRYTLFIAFFLGTLYYGLFFIGLAHTTPGNAALIAQFEVLTSFLFFNIARREHISREHIAGSVLMLIGACVVLVPNISTPNLGDLLILASTFAPPLGNLYQRKARAIASSETIMLLRSSLTIPIAFLGAVLLGGLPPFSSVWSSLPFLAVNGIILLGVSKIFWIEGIHRISVTKANALSSFGPLVTLLLAWLFLEQAPTVWQLSSIIPLIVGTFLLTGQLSFKART